jgi:hypothetical protein
MSFILFSLLRLSRLLKRQFGPVLPHWLKDLSGPLQYINFIGLIPTFAVVALAPNHFFRRLPYYLTGKVTYYKTPIKFVTSVVSFVVVSLHTAPVSMTNVYVISLIFVLTLPALIAVVCLAISIALFLLRIPASLDYHLTIDAIRQEIGIPLRIDSYKRLDWTIFCWSMCYYAVYLVFAAPITFLAIGVVFLLSQSFGVFLLIPPPLGFIPEPFKTALIILALEIVLIRPYISLLTHAMRVPTDRIHCRNCCIIWDAVRSFVSSLPTKPNQNSERKWRVVERRLSKIAASIRSVRAMMLRQNVDVTRYGPEALLLLADERKSVFTELLDVTEVLETLRSACLSESHREFCIEQIRQITDLVENAGDTAYGYKVSPLSEYAEVTVTEEQ